MEVPTFFFNINQLRAVPDRNNNAKMNSTTRKCLFGAADPNETYKLVEEQFAKERKRFFDRFGVQIEDLENIAVEPTKRKSSEKLKAPLEKIAKQKRVLRPYNSQRKMTDFCQVKKSPSCTTSGLQKKLN